MTIRPDFDIHNADPAAEDPVNCRLVLEICPNALNWVLLNTRGMRPAAIKSYRWKTQRAGPTEEVVRDIVEGEPIFSALKPAEVFIVYNFPESQLMPEKFYTGGIAAPLSDLVYGDLSTETVMEEKVPWFELHNMYRVPTGLHHFLAERFPGAQVWHFYSLQLKCHKMFTAREDEAYLKIFFQAEHFQLMAGKAGQILLVQHYAYQETRDILYHVLHCVQELGMDRETLVLELSGMLEKNSAVFSDLEQYFRHIRFDKIEDSIKMTDELIEYPLHFFSSLLKMAICV